MPTLRPADDHGDARRRRRDDERRPAAKTGGGRLLPIVLLVGVGLLALICGGGGVVMYYLASPQMTMVDGSRETNAQGGTTSVNVTLRTPADSPGGQVRGKYYFLFSVGTSTTVIDATLVGRGGTEWRRTFLTPELATEPGPVTFWVEQRDGDSVTRVSPEYTIP